MNNSNAAYPQSVIILGSTGSVGTQALDVARSLGISVEMISANRDISALENQIREFSPRFCAVADEKAARELAVRVSDTNTKILVGQDGITDGIHNSKSTVAVNATLGEAGLMPTLAVIESGKRLALANKESLVIAGDIVNASAKKHNTEIIPVDSEHSAIFQSLRGSNQNEVKKILLTASGGPFFGYTPERLRDVTLEMTLAHPTWKMGQKITTDSATMMNKGFEVIEAYHLFGVKPQQIEVMIHRESILHSAVEYIDNAVIAQLGAPDMRLCIQYAITYPARTAGNVRPLDLFEVGKLTFARPDTNAFPLLSLAYSALDAGGAVPAVVNAANEVAVAAFLERRLEFYRIAEVVCETAADMAYANKYTSLSDIISADREARTIANSKI